MNNDLSEKWPRFSEFVEFREEMNEKILDLDHLGIKRFFTLDDRAYTDGAIPVKYKELMGLVASLVLKCEGCINYHIATSVRQDISRKEFSEAFNIGLIIGGSIIIPHLREAVAFLDECLEIREQQPELLDF